MSADPKKNPNEPSREQMMRVLIPAGAIALIVILVAVLVAFLDNKPSGDAKNGKGGEPGGHSPPTGGTDVSKMTDGSDPVGPDDGLKEVDPVNLPGLKYRDLKEGDGPVVRRGAKVTAYYTGWLTNGTVFDSSRKRGEPIPFSLNGVIKGWTEGIPGMKVRGIRKLYIPGPLAYPEGRPGIPPNSTLIFEVEIVDAK